MWLLLMRYATTHLTQANLFKKNHSECNKTAVFQVIPQQQAGPTVDAPEAVFTETDTYR